MSMPSETKPEASPPEAAAPPPGAVPALDALMYRLNMAQAAELARAGKYAEADAILDGMGEQKNRGPVCDLRARICAQQGRLGQAEAFWKQALLFEPGNPDYQAGLDYIYKAQRPANPRLLLRAWLPRLLGGLLALALVVWLGLRLAAVQRAVGQPAAPAALPPVITVIAPAPTVVVNVPESAAPADLDALRDDLSAQIQALGQSQASPEQMEKLLAAQESILASLSATPAPLDLSISLPGVQAAPQGAGIQVTFTDGLFLYESALSPQGAALLTRLGQQLEPHAARIHIAVTGYVDDSEDSAYFDLGLLRALRVFDHLTASTQLPPEVFSLQPQAAQPAPYPNDSPENRARNRTVTLLITARTP